MDKFISKAHLSNEYRTFRYARTRFLESMEKAFDNHAIPVEDRLKALSEFILLKHGKKLQFIIPDNADESENSEHTAKLSIIHDADFHEIAREVEKFLSMFYEHDFDGVLSSSKKTQAYVLDYSYYDDDLLIEIVVDLVKMPLLQEALI